jgi:hypothetical protein
MEYKIYEAVESHHNLRCDKCGFLKTVSMIDDAYDAAMIFVKEGWVYKRDKVLCDKCANKKL